MTGLLWTDQEVPQGMATNSCPTPKRRGVSLGGTLLAVAVLSLLAFTLASLSVTHLRLSSRQEHGLA